MPDDHKKPGGLLPVRIAMVLSLVLLFGSIAAYGWFARAVGIGQPQLLAQVLDHINGWIGWAALVLIGVPLAPAAGRGIDRGIGMYRDWRSGRRADDDGGI